MRKGKVTIRKITKATHLKANLRNYVFCFAYCDLRHTKYVTHGKNLKGSVNLISQHKPIISLRNVQKHMEKRKAFAINLGQERNYCNMTSLLNSQSVLHCAMENQFLHFSRVVRFPKYNV